MVIRHGSKRLSMSAAKKLTSQPEADLIQMLPGVTTCGQGVLDCVAVEKSL